MVSALTPTQGWDCMITLPFKRYSLAHLNQYSFFGYVLDLIGFEPRLTGWH
jgi:hypothetical protein